MKKMYSWSAAALLAGLMMTGVSHAQESFRFGVVNPDRVMREAPAAKAAQTRLEQEFLKREKDLKDQEAALKAASDKLERDAPTLSETQRTQRQRQLVDQDRDFQRKRREFQEDLNLRRSEELQKVYESAQRAIKQVAEAEKYDVILQDAVYVNPKHDITDKVIKALNAAAAPNGSGSK
ncbi:OmpH family outer membrane protein [Pseudacidovorax intermedius]|uniref:OmpH family outer membrane protein n=1 Tax=Pseudacidovorax intermedius TaxID=433924 RepID=UPI0026F0B00F|nr:OmpH family outer membrane protein [Pseudacidovorax intermedius]